MARWSTPSVIENPTAYENAKQNYIRANANKTRRRKLEEAIVADGPSFRAWLLDLIPPELAALSEASDKLWNEGWGETDPAYIEADRAYQAAQKKYYATRKPVPEFIRDALIEWGGLTDGQLAFARKRYAEINARAEQRDAQEAERRANAAPWTAGRQAVEGVVQSARWHFADIGYGRSSSSLKGLLLLDDGRKIWTSIPAALHPAGDDSRDTPEAIKGQRLTFTVTVQPSDDDPTMAFGSRPSAPKLKEV